MKNIGRGEINLYAKIIKKITGTYRYITNFNFISKSKKNVAHHYDISEKLYDLFLIKTDNILVHILKTPQILLKLHKIIKLII